MYRFDHLDATTLAQRVCAGEVSEETVAAHFLGVPRPRSCDNTGLCFVRPRRGTCSSEAIDRRVREVCWQVFRWGSKITTTPWIIPPVFTRRSMRTTARPATHRLSRCCQAGALIMGKTHTTEFAYMHTGPTRNPQDSRRTPGSSSAGSAAGLAADSSHRPGYADGRIIDQTCRLLWGARLQTQLWVGLA